MKHNLKIILILTAVFFICQLTGLLIINQYIDHNVLAETGQVTFQPLPGGIERPQATGNELIIMIIAAVLVGTGLLLVLAKFKRVNLWRVWYSFSVAVTLFFAFGGFFNATIAIVISVILTFFKVFRPNIIVHNVTEVFIYGGLAAIFVPIGGFTVFYAFLILALISVYDMYAVWKSKHMVTLANFTTESRVFAGLTIPYSIKKGEIQSKPAAKIQGKGEIKNAILGGGDIGFPLLFSGVVMKTLMATNPFWTGLLKSLIIPIFATIALLLLFLKGQKNKFYPAMPYLTAGCIVGYVVLLGLNLIF